MAFSGTFHGYQLFHGHQLFKKRQNPLKILIDLGKPNRTKGIKQIGFRFNRRERNSIRPISRFLHSHQKTDLHISCPAGTTSVRTQVTKNMTKNEWCNLQPGPCGQTRKCLFSQTKNPLCIPAFRYEEIGENNLSITQSHTTPQTRKSGLHGFLYIWTNWKGVAAERRHRRSLRTKTSSKFRTIITLKWA